MMRISMFCLLLPLIAALSAFSHAFADTNTPPEMGHLGCPLGTVLEVEAKGGNHWGRPSPIWLYIYKVNGKELMSPIGTVSPVEAKFNFAQGVPSVNIRIGDVCILKGTESLYEVLPPVVTTNSDSDPNSGAAVQCIPLSPGKYSSFDVTEVISVHSPVAPNANPLKESMTHGLQWLVKKQNQDGSWGNNPTNEPALTSLAILAFVSNDKTPPADEFGPCVERGMKWLVEYERSTSSNTAPVRIENEYISTKDIVTLALIWSYGTTQVPMIRDSAANMLGRVIPEARTNSPSCWQGITIAGAHYAELLNESGTNEFFKLMREVPGLTDTNTLLYHALLANALQFSNAKESEHELYGRELAYLNSNWKCDWHGHKENYPLLSWYFTIRALDRDGGIEGKVAYKDLVDILNNQCKDGHWEVPVTETGSGKEEANIWGGTDANIYATSLIVLSKSFCPGPFYKSGPGLPRRFWF